MDNLKQTLLLFASRFVYGAIYLISLLPMTFLYAIASFTFFVAYNLVGYRKEVVIQNVARSFPEKQYGEIRAIVKKFYQCFVAYFAEMIKNVSVPTKILDKKMVFENLELVDLYIKSGRNVIASVGHCGNWEALSFLPHKVHYDVHAVYKPLSSRLANCLMVKLRSRFGMKLVRDIAIARYILSKNSSPAVYLFIADQRPKIKEEEYKFTLLNQETYFFSGMEKLARTSRAAVIYLNITQLTKGNYKVKCIPINAKAESTKVGEITQKYVELLTENIKEEPYGWLWTHKRWKR
ncbi:MAG: lipid A biosynthesis acyltransferase [Chryseobacterium sp.]|nr:MAG: lipid A biosynthesis acyltransferase [Chryseobacterium sp.]